MGWSPFKRLVRKGSVGELDGLFGRLEIRALESLWRRGREASVRDLQTEFPEIAYTTLMTTLDRLHRKGVLRRTKAGRAFLYQPLYSREELRAGLAQDALGLLIGEDISAARPILSLFVEAISRRDSELLDDLEEIVREKRRERKGGKL